MSIIQTLQNTEPCQTNIIANYDLPDGTGAELGFIASHVVLFTCFLNARQHEAKSHPLDHLTHLTLVALMTTLLPKYGYKRSGYPLLSDLLRTAIQNFQTVDVQCANLMLWALFTGGISVLDIENRPWLITLSGETCERLHLRSWADVKQRLNNFCWIHLFHDDPAHAFWESMPQRGLPE